MKQRKRRLWRWSWLGMLCLWLSVQGCDCGGTGGGVNGAVLRTDLPGVVTPLLDLAQVSINKVHRRTFLLYNDGTKPVTLQKFGFDDAPVGFALENPPATPFVLQPGKAKGLKLTIRFAAQTDKGMARSTLQVLAPSATNVDAKGRYGVTLFAGIVLPTNFPGLQLLCGGELFFGKVARGQRKQLVCGLRNILKREVTLEGYQFQKTEGVVGDFLWRLPRELPMALPGNGQEIIDIQIVYQPTQASPDRAAGVFTLDTNLPNKPENKLTIEVSGQAIGGRAPALAVVPEYLACQSSLPCLELDGRLSCIQEPNSGRRMCGQSQPSQPLLKFPQVEASRTSRAFFSIYSTGKGPLDIASIALADDTDRTFRIVKPALPLRLEPGKSVKIEVNATRLRGGQLTQTVLIRSNDPRQPLARLLLEIPAKGCQLEASPLSLEYEQNKRQDVLLTNIGDQICGVQVPTIVKASPAGSFQVAPVSKRARNLRPGQSAEVGVLFVLREVNKQATAILQLKTTDVRRSTISVPLVGKVVQSEARCVLQIAPVPLSFQRVAVGRQRIRLLRLRNVGQRSCTVRELAVENKTPLGTQAFRMSEQIKLPLLVRPGRDVILEVGFRPDREATFTGRLRVKWDTVPKALLVPLLGTSATACLVVVPEVLEFGALQRGCKTKRQTVTVYNLGGSRCPETFTLSRFSCVKGNCTTANSTGAFRVVTPLPAKVVLGVAQKFSFEVEYKPRRLGRDRELFEFATGPDDDRVQVVFQGRGIDKFAGKEVFWQQKNPKVDMLIVLDNSCSMGDEQEKMARSLPDLMRWAQAAKVDYHIGVATTDVSGRLFTPGCFRGTPRIITPKTPNPIETFARNVKVGTYGLGVEKGLEAAYRALTPLASEDPACNKGFYRKDAVLSVVFVSDESDQSSLNEQFYIDFFRRLKDKQADALVRVSAIVGPPPKGCKSNGNIANASPRYWKVADALGGVKASICEKDWGPILSSIGQASLGYRSLFQLARPVRDSKLQVRINGRVVPESATAGWTYVSTRNAILFAKSAIPKPGSFIEVFYTAACLKTP